MNLSSPSDYSPGFPFKNLMWGARPWLTKNLEGGGPFNTEFAGKLPLDAQGYPLELPYQPEGADKPQIVFTIIPNTVEPGEYVVLYDGEGTIAAAMETRVQETYPGRVVLELKRKGEAGGGGYEGIAITRSTKGNHVRNIRILALADERADLKANPFRDDFLAYAKQWHALRFMDWQATNNSLEKEWGGRKRPDFYTMVGGGGDPTGRTGKPIGEFPQRFSGGVALEIIIQLANLTQTDPWICVPHRATPEYITEMARLFKTRLDPRLKVYMEYSNEVWNWQFQQAGWMIQSKLAGDLVTAKGGKAWKDGVVPAEFPYDNGDVAKEGGEGHPERMGALNRYVFGFVEKVFSGADRARLVRVVGVQHNWVDTANRTARWVMENGGADALSPAGYFGPTNEIYARWEAAGASLTADQVIADMREALETRSAPDTRAIAEITRGHGLRFVVYEGGQHIQPKGQKKTDYLPALKAAQFHPGMYDVYMKNFALHQEVGCDLFGVFASISVQGSQYGSWGHQEYYGQSRNEIPKYGALLDANTPRSK
ncbi:MAG: hypothetical protein H7Y06_08695 [Opitutaceae bacterium]|nr:hypothetical protein [Opitutaceae bacterium]